MAVVSMKNLLESGVHFGHTTRRWEPKMAEYIYTSRNGIHIIDLQKTAKKIEEAYKALNAIVDNGGKVLFVGTKKQASDVVKEQAIRCEEFYVTQRWLGGTLTNFKTIRKRIRRLHDLYKMEKDGTFKLLPKKEVIQLIKERDRLEKFLYGIKDMRGIPQALFVVDPKKERNAIAEARILKVPVFGIVDTNCDPDLVDYIIPANDDAIRAVKLIVSVMANAVCEAKGLPLATFDSPEPDGDERRERPRRTDERRPRVDKTENKEEKPVKKTATKEKAEEPKEKPVKKTTKKETVEEPKEKSVKKAAKKEEADEPKEKPAKKTTKKEKVEDPTEKPAKKTAKKDKEEKAKPKAKKSKEVSDSMEVEIPADTPVEIEFEVDTEEK